MNVKTKNMTQLIEELKDKLLIKTEEASLLHNNFDGLQLSMFTNTLQNAQRQKQGKRYTEAVKEFAITLYFYSPRAYNFVRDLLSLPHPSMIRKWSASIDCEPGFISEAIHSLAKIIDSSPEKKDCALMLDGMAIRKQVIYDPKKTSMLASLTMVVPLWSQVKRYLECKLKEVVLCRDVVHFERPKDIFLRIALK